MLAADVLKGVAALGFFEFLILLNQQQLVLFSIS
jgi:hypothetical protein